jgi:ABC-2 type transport system ATP-binding protein
MEIPVIEIIDVTKKIGNRTIIESLTLKITKGQIFGLLGPNGAGKTTIIRMIVGLLSLTHGNIFINGKSIKNEFTEAIANIGAIVETPAFYPYLSGYKNLRIFAKMVPNIGEERIKEVVAISGLKSYIDDTVKTYSLGMRQRLGLAQALLGNAPILILDEPTNGLDPAGIKELREYLRSLASCQGRTIIVSSHLLSEMELMCDRIAIIQKGKLIDVQKVGMDKEENPSDTVLFEVNDLVKAKNELEKFIPRLNSSIQGGYLQIIAGREDIAKVNTILVNEGVQVYSIRPKRKTLEERFMEITGGDDDC